MIATPSRGWRPRRRKPRATSFAWSRYSFHEVACHCPSRLAFKAARSPWVRAVRSRASDTVSRTLGMFGPFLHLLERLLDVLQALAAVTLPHEVDVVAG